MSEWISTKDRLPEIEQDALIYLDGYCFIARRVEDDRGWIGFNGYVLGEDVPTHWMPLPDPPKEQS
jgi:hypothetical protein